MFDPRITQLAKIFTNYSLKVKQNDKVLIECSDPIGLPLAKEVWKQVLLKKAYPHLNLGIEDLNYFFFKHATSKQLNLEPKISKFSASWADKMVRIRAAKNDRHLNNIDAKKLLQREKVFAPLYDILMKKPWVMTEYPTHSMAQTAGLAYDELIDFYFQACLQDWEKINLKLQHLKKIMDRTEKVTILGLKTKLTFSLKGRFSQVCAGQFNMPDGEIFGAPLDGTMTGNIYFDFPSLRSGKEVKDILLTFKNGQVTAFSASQNQKYLSEALKIDPGASRPGEFAIATNYGITKMMNNILFDEKIGGTIHLALGRAYEGKEGGGINQSCIHWDLIKDMRKPGSQVIMDGKTVLKDGKIVL